MVEERAFDEEGKRRWMKLGSGREVTVEEQCWTRVGDVASDQAVGKYRRTG
jgi:ribosomal protein L2